jgi:hypothetical protein
MSYLSLPFWRVRGLFRYNFVLNFYFYLRGNFIEHLLYNFVNETTQRKILSKPFITVISESLQALLVIIDLE